MRATLKEKVYTIAMGLYTFLIIQVSLKISHENI